jgi:hypothetical protein
MKHAPYEGRLLSMSEKQAELKHKTDEAAREKERTQKLESIENVSGWAREYGDELKKGFAMKDELRLLVPKNKQVTLEDLRHHGYFMNIWDMEPLLLDGLSYAKEQKREARTLLMRGYLRAASWATHRPVNPEVAKADAETFLAEAREQKGQGRNPFEGQSGFGFDEDSAVQNWERVTEEVGTMDCKGDRVEAATDFVEKQFVKEWKSFLSLYHEKGKKRTWPDRGVDVKLEPEVVEATERIIRMREIRDQLYYQRLFPKLCDFGRQGIKKRSA